MQKYIGQFLDYLRIEKGLSCKTVEIYQRDLLEFGHFAKSFSVKRSRIRDFFCYLAKKNNQSITRRRKLTTLRTFFQFLENEKLIKVNPVKNMPSPKVEIKEPSYLTETEIKRLWQAVKNDKTRFGKRNQIMVRLLIETGIRLNELTSLDVGDINTDEKVIKVKRKGNKEQSLPINAELNFLLKSFIRYKQPDEPLFISNRGKRITNRRAAITVQKFIKMANIEKLNISAHSLRHSYCVRLLEKGVNLKSIQLLCGHKSISTTERYLHISQAGLRKDARLARIG